jgi:hypothetical protein
MLAALNKLIYISVEVHARNVCENLENKSTYSLLVDWRKVSCRGYSNVKPFKNLISFMLSHTSTVSV